MKPMTMQEHTTALFVLALYYWYNEDKLNARNAIEVAVHVLDSGPLRQA